MAPREREAAAAVAATSEVGSSQQPDLRFSSDLHLAAWPFSQHREPIKLTAEVVVASHQNLDDSSSHPLNFAQAEMFSSNGIQNDVSFPRYPMSLSHESEKFMSTGSSGHSGWRLSS